MQHTAPALRYRVARSAALAWMLGAVALAGLVCVLAWLALGAGGLPAAARVAALLLCCAGAAGAWQAWRGMRQGWLVHRGGAWWFEPVATPDDAQPLHAFALHLDLQGALLLSAFGAAGGRHWLWLERAQDAPQWPLLRATVLAQCGRGAWHTIDTMPPPQGGQ